MQLSLFFGFLPTPHCCSETVTQTPYSLAAQKEMCLLGPQTHANCHPSVSCQ